jgi:chromosome partitioning protein
MIIAFSSSKGGVGKSTCCAAIAAKLAQDGDRVLVLDLDLNQTVARWGRKAKHSCLTVEAVTPDSFTTTFREKTGGNEYDHILIDLAGTREATILKAMARSDLVIVPAQASEPDLREALVIIDDIKDVIEAGAAKLDYRLLLTKMFPLPTRVTEFAYQEIRRHKLPVFNTVVVERAAYREMFLTGMAPSTANPSSKAAAEIAALTDEIRLLDRPPGPREKERVA